MKPMKKKLNMVLLCLTCIGVLACSVLSAQAVGPGTCTHPYYAESGKITKTEVYDFRQDGHYAQWGMEVTCLKCGWMGFTNTSFKYDSAHNYSETYYCDHTRHQHVYKCQTGGCPYSLGKPCTCTH